MSNPERPNCDSVTFRKSGPTFPSPLWLKVSLTGSSSPFRLDLLRACTKLDKEVRVLSNHLPSNVKDDLNITWTSNSSVASKSRSEDEEVQHNHSSRVIKDRRNSSLSTKSVWS